MTFKSARKKKITKAERLKQLQEEEERRQKEEEEARVKHEKEEMERLERQRIEREKWHQLEAKDLERRNEELEELYLLEECFPEAEKLKRDTRLLSQWNHYIQCDGSPDPSVSPEINTFISLWKEETNETLEEVIAKSKLVLNILKEGLQKYIYPPESTEDFETENAFPPIEVTLEVQENVIFFEDPMVARWDAEGKHWQTDGISNVLYQSEERLITFSLETFGPVTLIQDTHINMPFQSWELRPLDVNKVLLTVTTVFTEIQIQIKENLCMLASVKVDNKKHSSTLEGRWMTPISFILALKETGLNIFPTGHSHFYVVINHKEPLVEIKAYRQLALLSSAFAFGWSKWNVECSSKKVIVKLREHLTEEEPVQDPNWTLLMFSGDRAQRLKINENSETFSEALKEETEFHSTLYHLVKDFASKEAMEKIRSSKCQFIDSVCYMLLSTRLLSYS
ncbi:Hypothetical predicted protein [Lynx pardinus]|uniref:Dynein axonemal intermediate chain 7 n=1 Tax=Lynx pardinus TaxID=191816 RepID=A0A485NHM3_LYNPA|nr:Hypothetical predicted protein [Lynx pardinus]